MTDLLLSHKKEAVAAHSANLDPTSAEKGKTASEATLSNSTSASIVSTGFFMDGDTDLSIVDSKWSVDVYL